MSPILSLRACSTLKLEGMAEAVLGISSLCTAIDVYDKVSQDPRCLLKPYRETTFYILLYFAKHMDERQRNR